jgi:TolB-like protein/Flp pilus assembly protein TadD
MTRRVPHVTGAYLAAVWAIVEVMEWLADQGMFGRQWVYGVVAGLVALLPSVLLVTYTHGAHGQESVTTAEKVGVPLNLLLTALLMTYVHQNSDVDGPFDPISESSVAVLPFINLSDDASADYFGRGLSEELINAMARIPGVHVASRTSSFIFDNHDEDPREIARKLRVASILDGSVRKQGNSVRVTANLINGRNNYHVWTKTYNHELEDIFQIQEDIARSVASELIGVLQPNVISAFSAARAATFDAYDFYLRGLSFLHQPPTAESLSGARGLFLRALDGDGDYAPAYAGLCQVSLAQYVLENAPKLIDQAESDCLKALRLDDRSREVRSALGVLYRHTGDLEESSKIFHDLLKDQRTPSALIGLAQTEVAQGSFDAAERAFQSAIEMEPGNWHNQMALAEFLYWRGRFADAATALHRVIALSPDNARAYLLLGASQDYLGDSDASLRATLKSIELSPTRGAYRDLGLTYYYLGDFEKALDAFKYAVELGPTDHWSWGSLADVYRLLGGHEDESRAAYHQAAAYAAATLQRNEKDWVTLARLAMYDVMSGAVDDGLARIRMAVTEGAFLNEVHYYDAVILAHLGQDALALDALQHAIDRGYPVRLIAADPEFIELRNDARFGSMIEEQ